MIISQEIKIDTILYSSRRTLALEIKPNGELIVRAPKKYSLGKIEKLVATKKKWILTKQKEAKERFSASEQFKPKFHDGAIFLYCGNKYPLKIVKGKHILLQDELLFPEKFLSRPLPHLILWYRKEALRIIKERMQIYAPLMQVKFRSLKITSAKRRWGSCSIKGNICFSWRLILTPLAIIDYVVVHELAHLKQHNHSKAFWYEVAKILPNHKQYKKWLKIHRHELGCF